MDFLCHNPVTLAALFEFDILIYSLRGFMELEAFPCAAHHKEPLTWIVGTGEGSSEGEIKKEWRFDTIAGNTRIVVVHEVTHDCSLPVV